MSTQPVFPDKTKMMDRVRSALNKPTYDVCDFYHQQGIVQRLARSSEFEVFTLFVITCNSIWIAIDTDLNTEPDITKVALMFRIADNFFCAYFTFEWLVRFLAFETKRNCLRDAWFCFDSVLCTLMIFETWLLWIVFSLLKDDVQDSIDVSALRLLRLLRLTRTARMAKVLRAMPEMLIMIKGIMSAFRSVFFTLLLLCLIIYIYAIAFRQITAGSGLEYSQQYFPSVPGAALQLLLWGALPDFAQMVENLGQDHWGLAVIHITFVLLSSLTVLNMLVGVLCEVVSTVAIVEREQMAADHVKTHLLHLMRISDLDHDDMVNRDEFHSLLCEQQTIQILAETGVDIIGLLELSDFFFKDTEKLSFDEIFTLILQLRGSNSATVKDIVDTRKFVMQELKSLETTLMDFVTKDQVKKSSRADDECSKTS
jgi:voltage-gated sodium channel